jgi:hypothetical protein
LQLAFVALPLAILPGWCVAYEVTPKLVVLAIANAVLVLSAPEWLPGLRQLWRDTLGRLFCILLAALAASLTLSTIFSVHPGLSLAGTSWGRCGALTQISILLVSAAAGGYICQHPQHLHRLLAGWLVAGSIASVYAVFQYFGHDPFVDSSLYTVTYAVGPAVRPPATFGHTMYLAAFLCPVIFIAAAWATGAGRRVTRLALFAAVILALFAMVLSGARSALLGLPLGMVAAFAVHRPRIGKQAFRWLAVAVVLLAAAVTLVWSSHRGGSLHHRVTQWSADALGGPRLLAWKDSWALVRESPILGHGPETFAEEFRRIEPASFEEAFPGTDLQSPSNYFVDILIGQGVLGLGVALSLLVLAIFAGLKPLANRQALRPGLLGGFVALVVAVQFNPLAIPVAVMLYALAAILIASRCPAEAPVTWAWTPFTRVAAGAAACAVLAVATLYAVQDATFADLGKKLARGDTEHVVHEYRRLSRLPFPRPGEDLWLSGQLADRVKAAPASAPWALPLAREASAIAEQTSEADLDALYQSAQLAEAANDPRDAENLLRLLVEKAPHWYEPQLRLAELLVREESGWAGADRAAKGANGSAPKGAADPARIHKVSGAHHPAAPTTPSHARGR